MNYRILGSTGVKVPELALGTWQYRGDVRALRAGIDLGATFIDTAEVYGTEELVGQAIGGIRQQIFLATKAAPRHFRQVDLIRAAEGSLRRLKTDWIDLYQLHWPNYTVPLAETMTGLERLVESGKICYIGLSNFSAEETGRAQSILSHTRVASNQVRYNLIDRTVEDELLPYCAQENVSLLAFSPLSGGIDRIRAHDPEGVLETVAKAEGKSQAQVALQWCLSRPGIIAIFKAEKIEHVRENCAATGGTLRPEHKELLDCKIQAQRRNRWERFLRRAARRVAQNLGRNLGSRA